jgi:hypothetical protein
MVSCDEKPRAKQVMVFLLYKPGQWLKRKYLEKRGMGPG